MTSAGKFVIVSPNLRDHLGHYFESAVALAEAARRASWQPILATHIHCQTALLPDWLERFPLFFPEQPIDQAKPLPETSRRLNSGIQRDKILQAIRALGPMEFGVELEQMFCFERDLRWLLDKVAAGPQDQVLIGTAHPRQAAAAALIAEQLGCRAPQFHLVFLNAVYEGEPSAEASTPTPLVRMQRLLFSLFDEWGAGDRIRLYTDSARLAGDYQTLCGATFGLVPVPFRSELIEPVPRPPTGAVTLAYLGEPRDEKGFPWLPDLAHALEQDYLVPGRARLLIQGNLNQPQYNPQSIKALERLRRFSPGEVQLFAEAPLSPVDYYRMFSQADVVLLPYINRRYRACSSGILAEALALGAPAIVPADTWMADYLPAGGGETFSDFDSFVAAVKRVLDRYDAYREAAAAYRPIWRERQSPDAYLATLLQTSRRDLSSESQDAAIAFLGEQDGLAERLLKQELIRLFDAQGGIRSAYLSKVQRPGFAAAVALCIDSVQAADTHLTKSIQQLFSAIFAHPAQLNVLFLTGEQGVRAAKVCLPFYLPPNTAATARWTRDVR